MEPQIISNKISKGLLKPSAIKKICGDIVVGIFSPTNFGK
jgi:hypothetical protein